MGKLGVADGVFDNRMLTSHSMVLLASQPFPEFGKVFDVSVEALDAFFRVKQAKKRKLLQDPFAIDLGNWGLKQWRNVHKVVIGIPFQTCSCVAIGVAKSLGIFQGCQTRTSEAHGYLTIGNDIKPHFPAILGCPGTSLHTSCTARDIQLFDQGRNRQLNKVARGNSGQSGHNHLQSTVDCSRVEEEWSFLMRGRVGYDTMSQWLGGRGSQFSDSLELRPIV